MNELTPLHAAILPMPADGLGGAPLYSGLIEPTGETAGGLPLYRSPDGDVLIAAAPSMFASQFTGTVLRMADRHAPETTTIVTLTAPFPAEAHDLT